ncbi:hypothetical protein SHIRM173S_08981 [Streptomyces hirsutus]
MPRRADLLNRDFTAKTLSAGWCGAITYIAVGASWLPLATVIDIDSRRVVGWSIADHMRTRSVTDGIEMAVAARGGQVHGVVFHTDRGAQYAATRRTEPGVHSRGAISGPPSPAPRARTEGPRLDRNDMQGERSCHCVTVTGGVVGHMACRPGTAARAVALVPGEEYG